MTYVQPHFSCSVCILQKNDCHLLKLCCIQSNETVHIVCLLYIFILFLLCAKQKLDNNFECVNVLNLFCPFYILSYPSKYCDTDHSPCRSILWCWNVHVCVHCISLMSKIKTIKQIIHFSSRHCYFISHYVTRSLMVWCIYGWLCVRATMVNVYSVLTFVKLVAVLLVGIYLIELARVSNVTWNLTADSLTLCWC